MEMPKLQKQGMLSFHMREVLESNELLTILFDELEEEVQKGNSVQDVVQRFRAKMTSTAVSYMAKRYALENGIVGSTNLQA